jgi:prepilin-type N-terminal cleavage/methylation domain-containing protein
MLILSFSVFRKAKLKAPERGSREQGFTLIEMLVVLSILSILLSISTSSASLNRKEYLLSTSQEQLRALFSRAKALTVSGLFKAGGDVCGYGVRIDKAADEKKAVIFQFLADSDKCPESSAELSSDLNAPELSGSLNSMRLDKSLSFDDGNGALESLEIYFIPPDPQTVIFVNGELADKAVLEIKRSEQDKRIIKLNKAGLIDLIRQTR